MNVVDSSAWLEYFADGPNAGFFARAIEDTAALIAPSLSLYEVYKWILQQRGENAALQAIAVMQQGDVVALDGPTARSPAVDPGRGFCRAAGRSLSRRSRLNRCAARRILQ